MGLLDFFRTRFSRAKPTQDAFAELVLEQIRQRGLTQESRYDREQFRVLSSSEGDKNHIFNLHNAYRDYCAAAREERMQVLQRYLTIFSVSDVPSSFADARSALMPVLRSRGHGEYLRLLALREPQRPILAEASQHFGDDAAIMLAYDTESNMTIIAQPTLEKWGVTFETALAAAMDNLRERTPQQFLDVGDGLLMGEWHDAYDSSRLLLPDLLYRACAGGEPLVMVPTRERFLLASSNNVAGQLKMVALADQMAQDEGRHVSANMFGVQHGKIVACQPSDTAVAAALLRFQTMLRAHHYKEQKDEWDQLNQSRGEDIYIACYMTKQEEESEHIITMSAWTQGADTLLPRTGLVVMIVPDENGDDDNPVTKVLAWNDLLALAGDLMEEVDCYPVRYRVRAFPELQRLAAAPAWEL